MSDVSEREVDEYLAAALWTSTTDDEDGHGGDPLDQNYNVDDFSKEARTQARAEMEAFWREASFIIDALERDGHDIEWGGWPTDFWLTRNGHGAGFWDRPELYGEAAEPLTTISKRFGERYIYVGADEQLRFG